MCFVTGSVVFLSIYSEIMREVQESTGIKAERYNISNMKYADDTVLIDENMLLQLLVILIVISHRTLLPK